MKKQINLKTLGIKQLVLLKRMHDEELVIRVINDHDSRSIELQDEGGDNSYESVPFQLFNSLGNRNLFSYFGWMPALFVTIDTFKIKNEVIKLLGWKKQQQNNE